MEDFVKIFKSPQGDVYHITLSESNDILSKSVLEALGDVHIAGVDLRRYVKQHQLDGIRLSVVEINGINEKYYVHVIYRNGHSMLASMIGSDIKEVLEK